MKRVAVTPEFAVAAGALLAVTVGVYLVAGLGAALIVVGALVLVYILLPDQGAHE